MTVRKFEMFPPPGRPSNPPAWEDIERLSLHYPWMQDAVTMVERGTVTREQALIMVVFVLADEFQRMFHAELHRLTHNISSEQARDLVDQVYRLGLHLRDKGLLEPQEWLLISLLKSRQGSEKLP